MDQPNPGNVVYGVNPQDQLGKQSRPAIVLHVFSPTTNEEDADLLVIFGQTHKTGTGPNVHLAPDDHRLSVHGYFYANSIQRLPVSHFTDLKAISQPKDKWKALLALL